MHSVYMHTYALCGYTLHLRPCRYAAIQVNRPSGISQAAAIAVNRTKGVLKTYFYCTWPFSQPRLLDAISVLSLLCFCERI